MYVLENNIFHEQIINRSRFLCFLFLVESLEEVNEHLKEIRKKHYDASHHCYAYILGPTGIIAKSSDDGEPAGTAGVVIYDILKKHSLTNILAIVTRYFGGIKLGAGGLIRAYGGTVAKALEQTKILKLESLTNLTIEVDYNYYNLIEKYLESFSQVDKQFSDTIIITIQIPENEKEAIINELTNFVSGNITIH